MEESLKNPTVPCGLKTDAERARHVRKRVRQLWSSRGEWEPYPSMVDRPLAEIFVGHRPAPDAAPQTSSFTEKPASGASNFTTLHPILNELSAIEKIGTGHLVVLEETAAGRTYGRSMTVADRVGEDHIIIAKWIRRLTNWNGRQSSMSLWTERIVPLIEQRLKAQRLPVVRFRTLAQKIVVEVSLAGQTMKVPVDSHGVAFWRPSERDVLPSECAVCTLVPVCRQLPAATGVALLWRRLGLVEADGTPTRHGRIVSFFASGDGLAIAAALEDERYPLTDLIYDLANLDAGFRFAGDENRWGGRLADACHRAYELQSIPGYLENGLPPRYGSGADPIVAAAHKNPQQRHDWITLTLGAGDIDRIIIEWRSLLRRVAHSPELDWPRWTALQQMAAEILNETESPTLTKLPPLEYHQTKRVDHRLSLRRF